MAASLSPIFSKNEIFKKVFSLAVFPQNISKCAIHPGLFICCTDGQRILQNIGKSAQGGWIELTAPLAEILAPLYTF